MSHTPGPWKLFINARWNVTMILPPDAILEFKEGVGLNPDKWIADDVRGEANAHLIAAAPDLLEAARAARALINHQIFSAWAEDDVDTMLANAIAKAAPDG